MMRRTYTLLLACGLGCVAATNAYAELPWIKGNAYEASSKQKLYTELHYRASPEATVSARVEYVDQSQELIVAKTLEYSDSLATPAIEQIDYRNATKIFTRNTNAGVEVGYQRQGEPLRSSEIQRSERLVIDAGFDAYVREHWEALQAGRTVRGEFLVPARLDTVNIGISKTDLDDCEPSIEEALCLTVRPAGFLRVLTWFVDPLILAYDEQTQRLIQYKGISNLLDDEGNTQDVLITYEYPQKIQ